MKVSELKIDVDEKISKKKLKKIKKMLTRRRNEVSSCKKTLKLLEDSYNELIESNVEDLELDNYEY